MTGICIDAVPTENAHRGRGIGTVTREILRALDGLSVPFDQPIRYLSRRPIPDLENLQHVRRGWSADWTGIDERVPSLVSAIWQAFETSTWLSRDIARSHCGVFLATDPSAIPRGRSFRTVAIVYDLIPTLFPGEYLRGLKRAPRRRLLQVALARLRRADRLVAISAATRTDVIDVLGVPADRVDVAPLAVDRAVFRPRGESGARFVRSRFGLDRLYFLYVGEVDARKNINGLIEAFDRSTAAHPDLALVLAGVGERSRSLLESRLPSRLVSGGRLVFPGHVSFDELAALYSSAIALVYPSRYEGFGLPVLEAMSCGTPVITSPVSAMPEVAGNAAIYANPDDPEAIAGAMNGILTDRAKRDELVRLGLERASRFAWRDTALAIVAACNRAARARPAMK